LGQTPVFAQICSKIPLLCEYTGVLHAGQTNPDFWDNTRMPSLGGRWVLAHARGFLEPEGAAAAPDGSHNGSNDRQHWLFLVPVPAAAVTDGNIQANYKWDSFIQIL